MGCPIRKSSDHRVLPPSRSLSQGATSFIASRYQGIHQMPFSFARELFDPHATTHRSRNQMTGTRSQDIANGNPLIRTHTVGDRRQEPGTRTRRRNGKALLPPARGPDAPCIRHRPTSSRQSPPRRLPEGEDRRIASCQNPLHVCKNRDQGAGTRSRKPGELVANPLNLAIIPSIT